MMREVLDLGEIVGVHHADTAAFAFGVHELYRGENFHPCSRHVLALLRGVDVDCYVHRHSHTLTKEGVDNTLGRRPPDHIPHRGRRGIKRGKEIGRELDPVSIGPRHLNRREIGNDEEILRTEDSSRFVHTREHTLQVGKPEIVNMLVENIEPCSVVQNPVETGHFNVDSSVAVGLSQLPEKTDRIRYMFENMPQDDVFSTNTECGAEEFGSNFRI